MSSGRFRRGRWEMMIFAPPSFMSAIIQFESKPLAIVDKRRERAGESEVMNIIGDVAGKICIRSDQNSCPGNASVDPSMGVVNSGPPGSFHDLIGFDPCVVHYARCLKKPGCGFVIKQQMEINSPADPPNTFFPYGSAPNTLSSRIDGSIIVNLAGKLTFRSGLA